MIVEYIRYRIPADRAASFEAAYGRASASLAAASECVDYELSRCVDEPESYILRITWNSAEDHLEGFRGGEHFPPFFAEIKPYVGDIQEMRHYEKTAVRGDGGSVPTLYEWLGGGEALERLTSAFYREVLKDDLLIPLFAGMDPHRAGDERRQSEQAGDVEDIRADDDADAGVLVARDDRSDCGGDLRRVCPEGGDDPEQRLGEPKSLADPVELARQHDARRDRERERAGEQRHRDRDRHERTSVSTRSGRLLRRACNRDRRCTVGR